MSDWREQYERMKRWRDTIARDRIDPDRVPDIFLAFAQTCYHMVDWLENDASQPIRRTETNRYVTDSAPLSFCRDICNGSKHARLNEKNVALSIGTSAIGAYIETSLSGETKRREVSVAKLFLDWEGESVLALEFADRCIAEWDRLPRSLSLL